MGLFSKKKKKKAPVIPDPIVGEVAGNVLDEYASYSYSAKLYMIPPKTASVPGAAQKSKGSRSEEPAGQRRASTSRWLSK